MEKQWKNLYDQMLAELTVSVNSIWLDEEQIANRLQICNRYVEKLLIIFDRNVNAMWFRREILPQFLAEAEFCSYLSAMYFYCPRHDSEERAIFIERQRIRFYHFYLRHKNLIDSYESYGELSSSDSEKKIETIIAGWLAFKKYIELLDSIH